MPLSSHISHRRVPLYLRTSLRSGWIPAAAFLAQGIALLWITSSSGLGAVRFLVGAVALSALAGTGWKQRNRLPHIDALIVTAAVGGLGMLLGMLIDEAIMASKMDCSITAMPVHDMSGMGAWEMIWSWMTACMFLFCIPACRWFCGESCRSKSHLTRAGKHFLTYACMLAGMIAGGIWIAPLLHPLFHSPIVGSHISMVTGMVAGTYVGLRVGKVVG